MSEPERRRRRPPLACIPCRNRKTKCDRGNPCSHCLKSRSGNCLYATLPAQLPRTKQQKSPHHNIAGFNLSPVGGDLQASTFSSDTSRVPSIPSNPSTVLGTSLSCVSNSTSQPSSRNFLSMEARIKQLEEQLFQVTSHSPQSTAVLSLNSNKEPKIPQDGNSFSMYKTRMYGQSHWYSGVALLQDLFDGFEPQFEEDSSMGFSGIQKCKSLAKIIKAQRIPLWPSANTTNLPSKHIADELVDCYLGTIETVYRILHIPSFKRDYDALWMSDTQPNSEFLLQLKLVLAIGAVTHDDNFSLRTSATHWVHEAQSQLSQPQFKSRLNIQSLQTEILLLIAREAVNVGGELIWISAGSLLRTAVYMGLHRDPINLAKKTAFATEMRRRLWNTILEINLQSSIISGGHPFVSLSHFDTKPPGNFDDEQLSSNDDLAPRSTETFTQTSVAIALRETLPLRLSIIELLNRVGPHGSYEETLRLDKALRASYKNLRQDLQTRLLERQLSSSRFDIRVLDLIINHYLSSLHIPFLSLGLHETVYAFSRKVVLESSLKIWYSACPSVSLVVKQPSSRDDLARFTICGSGLFHTVAFQATLMIAIELKNQIQEEEGMGPVPLRPDLFTVLKNAEAWSLRCLEAGETNIKTYILMSLVLDQINRRMRGLEKDESSGLPVTAVIEAAQEICLTILKSHAAQGERNEATVALADTGLNSSAELMEDWDLATTDDMVSFGDADPMSWLFNCGNVQEDSHW